MDDRARVGIEHLQAAAREMIAAGRALLDVAEELVEDPAVASSLLSAFGSFVKDAARFTPWPGTGPRTASGDEDEPGNRPRVEHIKVS